MRRLRARGVLGLLVGVMLGAVLSVAVAAPAIGASKPVIGAVVIRDREFLNVTAHVTGASAVAICVSRRCRKATRSLPSLWILNANQTPRLHKGERREVVVFAVSPSGQISFASSTVTVR